MIPSRLVRRVLLWAAAALTLALPLLPLLAPAVGLHTAWVLSDSMQPTFGRGDLVVTRRVQVDQLRVGDVPALRAPGQVAARVHRVTEVRRGPGPATVQTRGDANPAVDPESLVLTAGRVPVVVAVLPLGRFELPTPSRAAGPTGVAALGLLATAVAVRRALRTPTRAGRTPGRHRTTRPLHRTLSHQRRSILCPRHPPAATATGSARR